MEANKFRCWRANHERSRMNLNFEKKKFLAGVKFKFLNFCLNDLNKFNWHCLLDFDVLYNFAFESVAIGRSVQPQTHENRLRESERPFVYGDLRPNNSSDRIKSKRLLVEY